MKAESRQIPQKLAARQKFVCCLRSVERIPATTVSCKMLTFTKRTMRQEKEEVTNCHTNKKGCVWNKE